MKANPIIIGVMLLTIATLFFATAIPALAMNEELIGAVVKTDQGVALSTDSGEYLLLGQDLGKMAGKTVAVTGNVEDGVLSKTIRIASVKVLSNKDIIDPSPAGAK
jgi:hypothetical protein